jgi:hypothetical protein
LSFIFGAYTTLKTYTSYHFYNPCII